MYDMWSNGFALYEQSQVQPLITDQTITLVTNPIHHGQKKERDQDYLDADLALARYQTC